MAYQKWLPGSDIPEGWYWHMCISTGKMDIVRNFHIDGEKDHNFLNGYCWENYPESWSDSVLYGPIPQPEVTA